MAGNSYQLNKSQAKDAQYVVTTMRRQAQEIKSLLPAFQKLLADNNWHYSDADYPAWKLEILADFERMGFYQGVFGSIKHNGVPFGNPDAIRHEAADITRTLSVMKDWLNQPATRHWVKGYTTRLFAQRPALRQAA